MKVAVFGAGAWGTALACHLARRHDAVLWAHDRPLIETLSHSHENERYLRGVTLPASLRYEADLATAVAHAVADNALCVVATPVAGLRALCRSMRESGVVAAELPEHASNGTLSGPSFAREVGQALPVALTVASRSATLGERTVAAF